MSFEKPNQDENLQEKKLNLTDAQQEANMLRASMEWSRKGATPEDYDQAMQELDELKKLAAEDPKGVDKLHQRITQLAVGATLPFELMVSVIKESTPFIIGEGYKKAIEGDIDFAMQYFTKDGIAWTEAQRRLAALKAEAERLE